MPNPLADEEASGNSGAGDGGSGGSGSSSGGGGGTSSGPGIDTGGVFDARAAAEASGLPPIAPPAGSRLIPGWHGRVLVGVLPLWLVPNGHAYWVQRLHELPGAPRPLVVRATHTFGGLPAKRHRLREAQLFADGAPYFYTHGVGPK